MPVLQSAKKALRRDRRRALVNDRLRSRMRRLMFLAVDDPQPERTAEAYSEIDRAVKKHVIHRNTAARLKSRLVRAVRRRRKPQASP